MSNIWVTTDWHAIEIDERTGRKSISNSFLKLTRKAEKLVQQNDIILCLGDIAFRGQDDIVNGKADEELSPFGDMIRNMPGYKILVKGNHDGLDNQEYLKVGFQEVGTAATLGDFLFTHKPYPVSNDQVNVHGHTHHEHYIGLDDGKHVAIPPTEKSNDPPLLLLDDVLEQAKQKRMKEPMRTVQHLKDADREFCHKLATDSDYLKEVISLEDSYEAVMANGLNESIIIPQDNFILNYDKWDYGMPLWITGASGDGKSTLANKLAKDNNAIVVSTDYVLMHIGFTPEEFENKIQKLSNKYGLNSENNMLATEYINTHPNLPRGLRDPKTKTYNRNKTVPEMVTYFEWVYNKIRTDTKYHNQKYIIEGCEISHMDPDFFVDKPIIIMGGSRIQSFYRRIKRNNPQNPKALLKSLIKHVRKYPIQNTILDSDKEKFRNNLSKTVLTIDESISPARIPGLGHQYIHPNAVQASMMLATMMDDGMDPTRETHVLEAIDPIDIDIETIDESVSEDNKLYPVYIMLMHSGTTLANAIKNVTHAEFSHSSISFDPSMKKMYSFGRPKGGKAEDGLVGSFKSENIHDKWFTERSIPFAVYVVPCTKNQIRRMKKRLDYFIQNATKFTYDFTGLIKNYFHVADNPEHRWFCSRFVADILNAGSPKGSPFFTEPSLVRPEDFKHTKFATFVTNGLLSKYNESFVKTATDKIFAAFNQNKKPIAESVTPYDIMMGQVMNENIFLNDDDLYYNKDKFDSGEINLCFITGLSGSGKSTMGMHMRDKTIEHYELDDLWCVADHFSMANLKEYGDLIYSFFKGPGKKYYVTLEYLKKNNISEFDYEYKLFPDFVHYAMKYAKLHKDKKFILEGIWLFCAEDRRWFNPKEFDDYAVYIKNTSVIVSMIRGAKRDASNFVPSERPREFIRTITKNFKRYFIDEKLLSEFRSYFIKKKDSIVPIDENVTTINLYHLSEQNMDGKTLQPKIPSNFLVKNGYEDAKTPRVCFAPSIDKSLMAMSQNLKGKILYVHIPETQPKRIYKPTIKEVPDSSITNEIWVLDQVRIKCIGTIEVVSDDGKPGKSYQYGKHSAELYGWNWRWINRINEATLSPMGLRKEDPKKKKKKLSKPDDPPKHTPGDDWDLVDKDHMVLPPDIQILEPHISENASMISHLPNQILDESVTLYHGSPSKFKKVRELRVESEEITNPNDTLSNKAVKLSFYDKNVKIGEASISAIDTNNGFLYDFEVFKQYRGRGYGRRIMQYIMSHYSVTDLTVDSSNMVAINLYKSFGFKRKQSYYDKVNKEKLEWYQRLPNTINETIPDIQILEPHVSENASVSIVSLHGGLADDFHEVRSDYEPPERKALRLHKKALEYKLANLDEGAVDYLLREIRAYKIRFDRHGNVRITKRETNHLKEHFNNSVNLLRAYRNADDIASVKQECMKLRYMSEILLKYYIRPNNHSDELKELINLRSTILNALNTNLKWVKQKDPKYNFAEEYDRSKYGSDINLPRNVVRDATKTIVTLLA